MVNRLKVRLGKARCTANGRKGSGAGDIVGSPTGAGVGVGLRVSATVGEGPAEVTVGAAKVVAGSVGFGVVTLLAVAVVTVALGKGESPGLGEAGSFGPPQAARARTASVARLNPTLWKTVNSFAGSLLRSCGPQARRLLYPKMSLPPRRVLPQNCHSEERSDVESGAGSPHARVNLTIPDPSLRFG